MIDAFKGRWHPRQPGRNRIGTLTACCSTRRARYEARAGSLTLQPVVYCIREKSQGGEKISANEPCY